MENIALAMDQLHLVEVLANHRPLTPNDVSRLRRGTEFLKGILSAARYLNQGASHDLDGSYFQPLRSASGVLRTLSKAKDFEGLNKYLVGLCERLEEYGQDQKAVSEDEVELLKVFFSRVAAALVSEEGNRVDDDDFEPLVLGEAWA